MTLRSMTGFARGDGAYGTARWHWELRSVNGRGLDVRSRLPPGFEALEGRLRETIAKEIARGNLTVNLTMETATETAQIRVNEPALAVVMAAVQRLRETGSFAEPRPEGVLALRGVLEVGEAAASDWMSEAQIEALLASLKVALAELVVARAAEGSRLATIVSAQLASIERIVGQVAASPSRAPEAIRQRLGDQLQRLTEAGSMLDEARLYQEAALLATRADVEEELKRLNAHVAAARDLLAAEGPAGRKLDFLSQEFNREANTLCSKANDVEIARLGLELKAIIDQVREQVQNIE